MSRGFRFRGGGPMSRKPTRGGSVPSAAALIVAAVLLTIPGSATGQTVTGTLQGTVTDTSGGVLPGAGILIRNTETGLERRLTTNQRGLYTATFLPIGKYRVEASLPGFGSQIRDKVEITLNNTSVENFSLDPRVSA